MLAWAEQKDRIHGFRMGLCAGTSTECFLANAKFEYAGRFLGANLSMPLIPIWASASVRLYPMPIIEKPKTIWRPYVYVGNAFVIFEGGFLGGGLGSDIHLTHSKRLCLQPSIGSINIDSDYLPAVSLSVLYTY